MKKVAFYTLGCKVNQYETNAMEQQFIQAGYETVENDQIADVYVVNTCIVTNVAERKSRQMLRRAKQLNPNAVLAVCGCYAEAARASLEEIEDINLIINDKEKANIVSIVENFMQNKISNKNIEEESKKEEFVEFGTVTYTEKNRAVVKVQDGCNMFCTYCIIPYARGRIRSRRIKNVVEEITNIAKQGVKEVVITGIHIASYGKDLTDENVGLIDLLEAINPIEGIERIRLGSLEPTIMTEEFLARLSKLEKICDHFHLSLQSGCDETLKRMNRKYTTEQFNEIAARIRKTYPDVSLTTDVIVGFPAETNEEFNITYNFLKNIKFYRMHIFKYSRRKGTVADKMPNQIDGNIKEERSRKLITLSNQEENEKNDSYIGRNVKVLFEEYENGYYRGHTTNYMIVNVKDSEENSKEYIDKIRDIKVIENNSETRELIGKLIDNN